jgi:hypothetical protein
MHFIKKLFLFPAITFLHFSPLISQLNFDFENGELNGWSQSTPGRWEVSTIQPLTGLYSLHHVFDNPSADNDQISYAFNQNMSITDSICWSFRLRHTYKPSSANNWAIFLVADQPALYMNPKGQINGIVAGVNFTGSDDILKIWKIKNGTSIVVLQSTLNWESTVGDSSALISIVRTPDNYWNINVSADGSPENLKNAGSGIIDFFPSSNYFGVYYKYSSSQDRKIWIDDIRIKASFFSDTIKPFVDTTFLSESSIELHFSEPIDSNSINKINYFIEPSHIFPDTIIRIDDTTLKLVFSDKFLSGENFTLHVSGIGDLKGNLMNPFSKEMVFFNPGFSDILITEIMADPDPPVGLPPYEYLELFNNSDYPINLLNWELFAGIYMITFPEYIIPSKSYLILCNEKAKYSFESHGSVLASLSDIYLLTNSGTSLTLFDSSYNLISFVKYSNTWYEDDYKKSGGWSLEMIDPENPCGGKENWLPSVDNSGGTPGRQNSVWKSNPDNIAPEYLNVRIPNDSEIVIKFSEPVLLNLDTSDFFLDNGMGYPVNLYNYIDDFSSLVLIFKNKLDSALTYQLLIKDRNSDCAGNTLENDILIPIAIPKQPDSLDVVINEVLFNSYSQGSEFIEIYNRSNKILNAGSIIASIIDPANGTVNNSLPVSSPGFLLCPKTYLAITDNRYGLEKFYHLKDKKTVIEEPGLTSLSDENAIVVLKGTNDKIIDKFEYNSNMHFSLLNNNKGVSLERLNPDMPTQSNSNWHSASQTAGFATPGFENSQYTELTKNIHENITVSPELFTPDNDGFEDFVEIGINPNLQGTTATIHIFNSSGILIRHITGKQYLGSDDILIWDGTSDEHKLEPPGIYIIYVLLLDQNGKTSEFKKVCVIGRK